MASRDDHTRVREVSCDQFGSQFTTIAVVKKKKKSLLCTQITWLPTWKLIIKDIGPVSKIMGNTKQYILLIFHQTHNKK